MTVEVLLACRWILALVLLCAGLAKFGDRLRFAEAVTRYAITPGHFTPVVAVALPAVEVLTGLALALGFAPVISGSCGAVLLVGFATAVGANLARGRKFDCGCGGVVAGQIGWRLLVRNLALAAIGGAVAVGPVGLSVSPHALAGTPEHVGVSILLPVPLTVVALLGLSRCVQSFVAGSPTRSSR